MQDVQGVGGGQDHHQPRAWVVVPGGGLQDGAQGAVRVGAQVQAHLAVVGVGVAPLPLKGEGIPAEGVGTGGCPHCV